MSRETTYRGGGFVRESYQERASGCSTLEELRDCLNEIEGEISNDERIRDIEDVLRLDWLELKDDTRVLAPFYKQGFVPEWMIEERE